MTVVAIKAGTDVTRPLDVLVPLIRDELQAGADAGLGHYQRAGEMLLEAKEQLKRGEFKGWLIRNFRLSQMTAERYMKLARVLENPRCRGFSTTTEAIGEQPRDARRDPSVRDITARIDVEALTRARQVHARELQMLHKLAHQLIDIGYKVLAAKLHPDKGGSPEAMARLNKVRNTLKEAS